MSWGIGKIAHMFDVDVLPPVAAVTSVDDAGLVDVIGDAAKLEAATMARRLAAMAELFHRRLKQDEAKRDRFRVDVWDCVCAEIAAAQNISRHRASSLLDTAVVLSEDLPKVAEVFTQGKVDYRVVAAVVSRTRLVKDHEDVARVDALLAPRLVGWNKLSNKKLADKIDWCVSDVDLLAKKEARSADEDRHIGIGPDRRGMAELWGSLRAPDALAFEARMDQLADTVCAHDPRTKAQRRADAVGAWSGGQDRLACLCDRDDCSAGSVEPAKDVAIQVLAEEGTVNGTSDTPGYVPGYGPMSAEAVRDLVKRAHTRMVRHPGDAPAELRYRPSAALADFVRFRDLTCRFPGCDVPAEFCDIDHTVPYPYGPTHASNLKCMCRFEHLIKTFYDGPGGWSDRQYPDGTVEWTSPTGHIWTTKPGGALFFPRLAKPTGKLVLPSEIPRKPGRGLMMPTRTRTRDEDRKARVEYERARNYKRLCTDVEPPPF
ncbi:HNH endonuclease signature motif containing protein [soil metagenome]